MNVYLTPEQVCKKLQIAKPTLYQLTRLKQIPYAKIGRRLRFEEAAIDAWFSKKAKAKASGKGGKRAT